MAQSDERKNLFAGCLTDDPSAGPISLLGLCDDSQSSYLRGSAQAPAAIRRAYDGSCYNSSTEWGYDLAGRIQDAGDLLPQSSWPETAAHFQQAVASLLEDGRIPCLLGGDHAVTVPAVQAFGYQSEPIHVIQFDAHPDLYPDFEGNPNSHACTGMRLLEMDHVASLTQVGIRASNVLQNEVAKCHPARLRSSSASSIFGKRSLISHIPESESLYITLDLDCLDPAFAPGVSHPVPGGLMPRDLLNFLSPPFPWRLRGIDIVEVNPARDIQHRTAILAGRLLHHAMALILDRYVRTHIPGVME